MKARDGDVPGFFYGGRRPSAASVLKGGAETGGAARA